MPLSENPCRYWLLACHVLRANLHAGLGLGYFNAGAL